MPFGTMVGTRRKPAEALSSAGVPVRVPEPGDEQAFWGGAATAVPSATAADPVANGGTPSTSPGATGVKTESGSSVSLYEQLGAPKSMSPSKTVTSPRNGGRLVLNTQVPSYTVGVRLG